MKNKLMMLIVLGIFLFSLSFIQSQATIPELEPVRLGDNVSLVQVSSWAISCNITGITPPNQPNYIVLFVMPNVSNQFQYNYTIVNLPANLGDWQVTGRCSNTTHVQDFGYIVPVTINGKIASTSDSIFYVVLLILSALFDIFLIWLVFALDTGNYKDSDGEFIGINLKKYGRILLVGVSYFFILLTLNLMLSVAASLSYLSQFAALVGTIFNIMLKLIIPWVIFIFIWMIKMLIKDYNLVQDIKSRLEEVGRI